MKPSRTLPAAFWPAFIALAGCVAQTRIGIGPYYDTDEAIGIRVTVAFAGGNGDPLEDDELERTQHGRAVGWQVSTDGTSSLLGTVSVDQFAIGNGWAAGFDVRLSSLLVGENAAGPGLALEGLWAAKSHHQWRALGLRLECDYLLVRGVERRKLIRCALPFILEHGETSRIDAETTTGGHPVQDD